MQLITMIDGSNLIPDIIDIETINEVAIPTVLLEELLQEYNPEIEEKLRRWSRSGCSGLGFTSRH